MITLLNRDVVIMLYDYIIVGAGLAGLHTGIELLKKYPKANVVILERFKYNGGRVVTYKHTIPGFGKVQWENGAGRIHKEAHPLVMKYVKKYGLTFIPIGDQIHYSPEPGVIRPNRFENTYLPMIENILCWVGPNERSTKTVKQLLIEVVGEKKATEFLSEFAYNSEIDTLRADVALDVFRKEIGSHAGFGIIKEGLSSLIDGFVADFTGKGGKILQGHRLMNINPDTQEVTVHTKEKDEFTLKATKAVILALHVDALKELPAFRHSKLFDYVAMRPLMRTYGVFAGSPFKGLGRIVSNGPIRYFLPANDSIAMMSYTDGGNAEKGISELKKDGEKALCNRILGDLRTLLGDSTIEEPIFFKAHPWNSGCSYWLPGVYDVEKASIEAHTPFPGKNVYICGESFSLRQTWMEGALEHAESLLKNFPL